MPPDLPFGSASFPSIFSGVPEKDFGYDAQRFGGGVSCLVSFSWSTPTGEAWFCRGSTIGSLHLVRMSAGEKDRVEDFTLEETSTIQRMWNGFVPKAIRYTGSSNDAIIATCLHVLGDDLIAFSLSRDMKFKTWSIRDRKKLNFIDFNPSQASIRDAQAHVAACPGSRQSNLSVAINVLTENKSIIYICNFSIENESSKFEILNELEINEDPLRCWNLSPGLLLTLQGQTLRHIPIGGPSVITDLQSSIPDQIDADSPELYLDTLLSQRHFSRETLLRTLQLWGSSPDIHLPMTETNLCELITKTLDDHIYETAAAQELESEEYKELSNSSWIQFYNTCRDYQREEDGSIGIFRDSSTGMVCIVTAKSVSFLRPIDMFEKWASLGDHVISPDFSEGDSKKIEFVLDCVNSILNIISSRRFNFDCLSSDLTIRQQADEMALIIASSTQRDGDDSPELVLFSRLLTLHFDPSTLLHILHLLHPPTTDDSLEDPSLQLACTHLYSSPLGLALLSESFSQLMSFRQDFALGLLVYCSFLLNFSNEIGIGFGGVSFIRSEIVPQLENIAVGYMALSWIANQKPNPTSSDSLEGHTRRLSALNLSSLNLKVQDDLISILGAYLMDSGGQRFRSDLASDSAWDSALQTTPCQYWTYGIPAALHTLINHIWPDKEVFFGEFLLANGQYSHLEKFITFCRRLGSPCPGTLFFLESQCLIHSKNYAEAYRCIIAAANYLHEPFFEKIIGLDEDENDMDIQNLKVQYFMKILQIFEEIPASDLVVSLASKVISDLGSDHASAAVFWSSKFKHLLKQEDVDGAYVALVSNPDPKRRRDYLRHFIMVLCERGMKKELCSYPYVGLSDQVSKVLVSRARGADLAVNNYYDILYSFHTLKGNFRQAAFFMCECASRLALEVPGIESMQKQAECYLAALNSLRLVDSKYAWIVRPAQWEGVALQRYQKQNKRKRGQEPPPNDGDRTLVKVLGIDQLKLEYTLILSNLQLLASSPDALDDRNATCLSPDETFLLLTQNGCFDAAFKLARSFHLALKPIFEALAIRCVQGSSTEADGWDWLSRNETSKKLTKVGSFSEQAWLFLREYERLAKGLGREVLSSFYPSVANVILSSGASLPQWFIKSYMIFFPSQLIHILLQYGLTDQAGRLTSTCLSTDQTEVENNAQIPITAADNLAPYTREIQRWTENARSDEMED